MVPISAITSIRNAGGMAPIFRAFRALKIKRAGLVATDGASGRNSRNLHRKAKPPRDGADIGNWQPDRCVGGLVEGGGRYDENRSCASLFPAGANASYVFWPIFGSVPALSRMIFASCFQDTSAATRNVRIARST